MGKELDAILAQMGAGAGGEATGQTSMGVAALADPVFLAKVRRFYRDYKRKTFASDAEMLAHYRQDHVWSDANVTDKVLGAVGGMTDGEDERTLKRDLLEVHRSIPYDAEDWGRYAAGAILDPVNLIPVGGEIAKGAQAVRAGKTIGQAVKAGATTGVIEQGLLEAGLSGAANIADQSVNTRLGLQDGLDMGELTQEVLEGGAAGGVLGGFIGGASAGLLSGRLAAKQTAALAHLGWSPQDIATMDARTAQRRIDKGERAPPPVPEAALDETRAPGDAVTDSYVSAMTPMSPEDEAAFEQKLDDMRIDIQIGRTENELARHLRDFPGDKEGVSALNQALDDLEALKALRRKIDENPAGIDNSALRLLRAGYRSAVEDPSPQAVRKALEDARVLDATPDQASDATPGQADSSSTTSAPTEVVEPTESPALTSDPVAPSVRPYTSERARLDDEAAKAAAAQAANAEDEAARAARIAQAADTSWEEMKRLYWDHIPDFQNTVLADESILQQLVRLTVGDEDAADVAAAIRAKQAPPSQAIAAEIVMGGKGTGISKSEADWANELVQGWKKADPRANEELLEIRAREYVIAQREANRKAPAFMKPSKDDGGQAVLDPTNIPKKWQDGQNAGGQTFADYKTAKEHAHREIIIDKDGYEVRELAGDTVAKIDRKTGEVVLTVEKKQIGPTRRVMNGQPVPFRGSQRTMVIDAENPALKGHAGRGKWAGKTVWYDPVTRAVYSNRKNIVQGDTFTAPTPEMRKAQKVQKAAERAAEKAAQEAAANDPLAILRDALARGAMTPEELIRNINLRSAEATPAPSARPAADLPDAPAKTANGNLALRHREDGTVRVLSDRQLAEGKGLKDLLGSGDISEWEVGHTVGSSRSRKAENAFVAYDGSAAPEAAPTPAPPKAPTITLEEANTRFLELTEAQSARVSSMLSSLGQLKANIGTFSAGFRFKPFAETYANRLLKGELSHSDLWDIGRYAEIALGWGRKGDIDEATRFLTNLYELTAEIAPERPITSTADIETAVNQLRRIGADWDQEDLAISIDVLRRMVAQNDGAAPDLVGSSGKNAFAVKSRTKDVIHLSTQRDYMPRATTVLHELAHWAYANVLDASDKLTFWRAMGNYLEGDRINYDLLASRTPTGGQSHPTADGRFAFRISNELHSPQEFFANQFSMWASQNRADVVLQDASFWQKVAHYVENLYRRYFTKEAIDADLVPLFEKLLPERGPPPVVGDDVKPGPMAGGTHFIDKIKSLRSTMDSLHESFLSTNDDDIIDAAMDVKKVLFGIGRLNSMSDYGPLIFGLANKMDEVFRTSGPQADIAEMLRNVVIGNPFEEGKKLNLDDAVNVINERLRSKFNARTDEAFRLGPDFMTFTKKDPRHEWLKKVKRRTNAKIDGIQAKIEAATSDASNVIQFSRASRQVANVQREQVLDFKSASLRQLADELEAFRDTDYGAQVAHELLMRKKAEPLDLQAERLYVREPDVQHAMKREALDYTGLHSEVGVAAGARATIRDAQASLTHRDGEVQSVMRTMFYRLANLADRTGDDPKKVLDTDFIGQLAGVKPTEPGLVYSDPTTTEFDALRTQLRRLAKELTSDVSSDPAKIVEEVVRLAARALGEEPTVDATEVGMFLRNHVESVPTRKSERYRDIAAYVLNGLIGRSDVKAQHPGIDNYGSIFGSPDKGPPPSTSGLANVVGSDARAAFEAASPARRKAILSFVGDGWGYDGEKKRPTTYFVRGVKAADEDALTPVVSTDFGPGVRVYAGAGSDHADLIDNVLDHLAAKVGSDSDEYLEAADLADVLNFKAGEVLRLQTEVGQAAANRLDPDYFTKVSASRSALREAQAEFDALTDELRSRVPADVSAGDYTQPVYIQLKNPLDMVEDFDVQESGIFSMFADYAAREGLVLDADHAEAVVDELLDIETMTGKEAYDWMARLIDDGTGTVEQVRHLVNEALKDLGFDGLVAENHMLLFDPAQVKHANAVTFGPSEHLWGVDLPVGGQRLGSINASLTQSVTDRKASSFAPLAEFLERQGAPAELTNAMSSVWRKRRLSMREGKVIREATLGDVFLAPNSVRMRKNGLHWLADWIAPENGVGHFERVASDLSRIVTPITRALGELPDTKKGLKGWAEHGVLMRQPPSHGRIVSALRRGKFDSLDSQERAAAMLVRKSFKDMLGELVDTGIMGGEGVPENYFPQVWSKERILQKSDEFLTAMSTYLLREAKRDVPPRQLDTVEALKKAQRIYDNLVSDDGVFIPPSNSGGGELIGDHIDYQRLIRLDQDDVALELLEPFLEKDLGAITTKYFDAAVRKIDMVARFGHGAHGYYDYLRVIEEGDEGVIGLLTSNKVVSKTILAIDGDNNRVEFELKRTTEMPFHGKPGLARDALATLMAMDDAAQMRNFLVRLAPKGEADPTYIRRAEAIASGIVDRRKMDHLLHQQEFEHARQTLRVIQRKPIDSSHASNQTMTRAYRALRNFNSVTLLSFTLLSSLGDVVMPLIRSGDFEAWAGGLRAMAKRDPEYRQMLKNVGVSIENILHERMVGLYGTGTSKFTTAFFQVSGLTPWTNLMREVSGSVAYEWFKKEMRTAVDSFNPRLPLADQPPAFAVAYRNLKTYGLDDLLARNVSIDTPTAMADIPELREAIIKFANKTVFSPNPDDLPIKAQTPLGAVLYQLKSFPLMMSRMSRDVLKGAGLWTNGPEKNARDFGPLLALMFAAPAAGMTANTVKDVVQGRGGEEGGEHKPRERLLTDVAIVGDMAEMMGMDPEDPGVLNAILGQYLEGLMMIGGFGLLGDMIHDSAEQLDNGAYGVTRVASTVFGPSVGTFVSLFNVGAGASSAVGDAAGVGDGTNSKERQAIREIVGRIPFVGGVRSAKEGATDFIAGEAAE